MAPADTAVLRLAGGRRLAYSQYGGPAGRPVLLFHGLPGSRLQIPPDIDQVASLGIRLIAVDRPGIGLSDALPTRSLGDWPGDVLALAHELHLRRFAVLGVSGGAPYAVACAWRLPQRTEAVAIVSGLPPLDHPHATLELGRRHRVLLAVARRVPAALALTAWLGSQLARRGPRVYLNLMGGSLPANDRRILARPAVQAMLAADLAEAFRQGTAGVRREFELATRPWGFAPREIRVPATLWHGEEDSIVPIGVGRRLAAEIPDCRRHYLPGAGHFFIIERWREILRELLKIGQA
jgi:pimeloyl-ACP methyl ester carboxylesterase